MGRVTLQRTTATVVSTKKAMMSTLARMPSRIVTAKSRSMEPRPFSTSTAAVRPSDQRKGWT